MNPAMETKTNTPGGAVTALTAPRLELVLASAATLRAAGAKDFAQLGSMLAAMISEDWPPDLAQDAFAPTADLVEREPHRGIWSMWWVVEREPRTLIGILGLKGPPENGAVHIGYGIVGSRHRRGYATEATRRLIELVFSHPEVDRVVCETLEGLTASMGVMEKCGFVRCAEGVVGFEGDEIVVQYELTRERWNQLRE